MSTLLLEELTLTSEPVLLNQPLRKHTDSGSTLQCWCPCQDQRVEEVCVPALLFWGAVWRVGRSGLCGGGLSLLSGLHALDLHLLNTNNKKGLSVFHLLECVKSVFQI